MKCTGCDMNVYGTADDGWDPEQQSLCWRCACAELDRLKPLVHAAREFRDRTEYRGPELESLVAAALALPRET